jgi:two-component sensor histidine kinase
MVEDSENDALLILSRLKNEGYQIEHKRVDTAEEMNESLDNDLWDIIIADYSMPQFSGLKALDLLKARKIDIPFILVSGTIGEEIAVKAMKAGAHDYILKDKLARLVPAVERELREAAIREKQREAESARIESDKKIKASLKEKEVMLQEIHHRVKNNLQIILSLLRLQSARIEDEKIKEKFRDSQNRIRSMALIHEKLYRSEDFSRVDFSDYIQSIMDHLFSTYGAVKKDISYELDIHDVFLDINKAIPCGLIINELLSNSLKHAFPGNRKGKITVKMTSNGGDKFSLIIKDDGVGFPDDFDFEKAVTLGIQVVSDLVNQIEGTIEIDRESGTTFIINF